MNLKLYILLFIPVSILAISCKTAGKLYEKGRYDEAVELAARKLQKDPDDPKLLAVLQDAYRFAVEDHESNVHNYEASTHELKWESIFNEYNCLQRLYESIHRSPHVYNRVKPTNYSSHLVSYGEKAGEVRYERGMSLMAQGTRPGFRQAYHEFQFASRILPGDTDVQQKLHEAYDRAVINVIVMPIEERSSYRYSSYNTRYRNFDNNMLLFLQHNNENEFVRYYSEMEARNRNIRIDQWVDIRFSNISVGRYHDEQDTRTHSRDVVVKEIVYKPDSIVKQYAKVHAKITTTKRTVRSGGMASIVIRDADGRPVWSEQYNGQHSWTTEFASYTGDIRALDEDDKQALNRAKENPPGEDDIIRSIIDEIQGKLECGLKDFYDRY